MMALVFVVAAWETSGTASGEQSTSDKPTFYKDVLPILQDHCQSCHRAGEVAPMPLVTYEQTRPWAGAMAHAVEMKMMPPWFADPRYGRFANDVSLTPQQVATISAWAAVDAPAGDSHDAPPRREWAEGWNIPHPDLVLKMPRAVKIPAEGEVESPTRLCRRILRRIGGCRCRSFAQEVPRMCIMLSCTFVRRIRSGYGTRRSASRSRHRC